jgi:membrane associated rhomboid family serine protease
MRWYLRTRKRIVIVLLPYRANNLPERTPAITVLLTLLNLLAFGLTSQNFDRVRPDMVAQFALTRGSITPLHLFSSLFLHQNLLHLSVGILFLWLFGTAVEGRIRSFWFLILFLASGIAGNLLPVLLLGGWEPLGAVFGMSGALLGLAGAYLVLFPYSTFGVLFWRPMLNFGSTDWPVQRIVFVLVAYDLFLGLAFQRLGGLASPLHLIGVGVGWGLAALLPVRRDDENSAFARAALSDTHDYSLLHMADLEALMQGDTEDMNLVMAYCERLLATKREERMARSLSLFRKYGPRLVEKAEPIALAEALLFVPVSMGGIPTLLYLRLASRLEAVGALDNAAQVYRRACDLAPGTPDTEVAMFRLAQLLHRRFRNVAQAKALYDEILRQFPNGKMALETRLALQQI